MKIEKDKWPNEDRILEIIHLTSLKIRLNVLNEMMLQSFLENNGYIPKGFWSDEKEKKYGTAFRKQAKLMTKYQIKEMKDWEKDGRPK